MVIRCQKCKQCILTTIKFTWSLIEIYEYAQWKFFILVISYHPKEEQTYSFVFYKITYFIFQVDKFHPLNDHHFQSMTWNDT